MHKTRALCDEGSLQAELVFPRDVFQQNDYNRQIHQNPQPPSALRSTGQQDQLSRLPALCRDYMQLYEQSAGPTQHQICGLAQHQIIQPPVKDYLGPKTPGLYRIPRECGRVYIGRMGRSVDIRLKEHQRHTRLEHPDKSAVGEYSINH
jgi:hypothetical protein